MALSEALAVTMLPRTGHRLVGAAGGVAVALALSACDVAGQAPNPVNGKRLFLQRCAACHSLDRAPSQATIAPDLDAAFDRALADGFGRSTIEGIVKGQILHPRRGSRMPAKLVAGQDAEDVAAYVSGAVAAPGRDTGALARIRTGTAGGPPGRRIFNGAAGCASCHKFSDAGAAGTVGPDLDRALRDRSRQFVRNSIVKPDAAIARGYREGVMPADYGARLSDRELDALVAYLADLAK
ncbi:MAG: c-type cytochrome [Solirubrobacteraceae bacterium]